MMLRNPWWEQMDVVSLVFAAALLVVAVVLYAYDLRMHRRA